MSGPGSTPRVWFLLPVLGRGGAERVAAELALRLPARGFRTAVVCLEDETAPVGRELAAAGVEVRGLHVHRRRTLAATRAFGRLVQEAGEAAPHLIHAHLFHANIVARLAASRWPEDGRPFPPVVCSVHIQERRWRPWQFLLDRHTARWCAAEVCVSRSVETFHRAKTGLPDDFFHTIENGVDLRRFAPRPPEVRAALRARLGLTPDAPLVLAAGRLDPQKNYGLLLEAWRLAHAQGLSDRAQLWLAGEGSERSNLHARLSGGARLLGFRDDLPDLLAACDLFVQPSAWEGQPLTVLEACAAGCAVVASAIGSHRDIFAPPPAGPAASAADAGAAVLIPAGDVTAWARGLCELLADPPRRARLAAAALRLAQERFSVDRMVGAHAALYRRVLAPDRG